MAARHYAQFLDASDPGQSADDDWRIAQAPPEVLRGSFRIYYIPRDDSSYGSTRYLLSVETLTGHFGFVIEPDGGDSRVVVYVNGNERVAHGPLTFSAGQEIELLFDGPEGAVTVTGATTGDGTSALTPWNINGSVLRLGGNVDGADVARGYLSLPYAVPGAPLPEPLLLTPTTLDFSESSNSALLVLI